MSRGRAQIVMSAALLLAATHAAGETAERKPVVEVEHHGDAYTVEFDAVVKAPLHRVYQVLTDFPALPALNPAIIAVRVYPAPDGKGVRVRSVLKSCIWFFCRKVVQVENVVEPNAHSIASRIVPGQGDFKSGWSTWQLIAQGGETRLHYEARRVPDFWIPPLIGPWAVEHTLRAQLEATLPVLQRLAGQPRARASSSLTSE